MLLLLLLQHGGVHDVAVVHPVDGRRFDVRRGMFGACQSVALLLGAEVLSSCVRK